MIRWHRALRAARVSRPCHSGSPLWDEVSLSERQEGIHIDSLCPTVTEDDIRDSLGTSFAQSEVLLMRSRLGKSTGRAAILTEKPYSKDMLTRFIKRGQLADPERGLRGRPMDKHDLALFVDQCQRFHDLSDDLSHLARPEHFNRVITISDVPRTYRRQDVCDVILRHCDVSIPPGDVIFRFKRWGAQSDTCYIIAPTEKDAGHILAQVQELAVPKHAKYGSLFGASFLWSSRNNLFVQQEELNFAIASPYIVFTTGWGSLEKDEFDSFLHELGFFPKKTVGPVTQHDATGFFLEFHDMMQTKNALMRLRKLKRRWRMRTHQTLFAHARRVDVHWDFQDALGLGYDDEKDDDADLDEPVLY